MHPTRTTPDDPPSVADLEKIYRPLTTDTDSAVSVVLKMRGETCDVDCLYCFQKRQETPGGAHITPRQVHDLGRLFGDRPLAVELHGGEPLTLGKPDMTAVLDALAAQPSVVRVALQTNGLNLDASWLDLFDTHCPNLTIGISLDGDAAANMWRVGYDGEPFHARVAASLRMLGERGHKVGIATVVTTLALGRGSEIIDHLASFGAVHAINLIPAFDFGVVRPTATSSRRVPASRLLQRQVIDGENGPAWAITPDDYATFVLQATARWIAAGHYRRLKLDPVVAVIARLRGIDTQHCHFSDRKCDHVFTLHPDGRLGSCDELPWPQARLTTLRPDRREPAIAAAQRANPLLTAGRTLMTACSSCLYRDTCGGGCVATRWRMHRAGLDAQYCDHRARLVDGVAALLANPADGSGALCRRARWRPRIPNEMRDVSAFLARWDDPHADRPAVRLRTSAHGNINTVGLPGIHAADDLDPRHPRWHEAIERRVRPLIDTLTIGWKAVTYDSCQGHGHDDTGLEPSIFRVGLLPRGRDEYAALTARACRALALAEPALPDGVTATLARTNLVSSATGTPHPVLELSLDPTTDWDLYFGQLDEAAATLIGAIQATEDAGTCACHELTAPETTGAP